MKLLGQLETIGIRANKQLPSLPLKYREAIVRFLPYASLIGAILAIIVLGISLLAFLALQTALQTWLVYTATPFIAVNVILVILSTLFLLAMAVLFLRAYSPLAARQIKGWRLAYFATCAGVAFQIIALDVMAVILALVSCYVVLQVRSLYKAKG